MTQGHLSSQLLIRAIDGETTSAEAALVTDHLAQCDECRERHEELRQTSLLVESTVAASAVENSFGERERLRQKLEARQSAAASGQTPERVMWRFGWGMAIAASLAVGIVLAPRHRGVITVEPQTSQVSALANVIEVGGESFVALPYSNPDFPVSESRIVEMQVPLSALNDVGIVLEPVSNRESGPDRSVLADVLMGSDGQPLGVHILE